jgi:hypothetical protein
MRRCKSCNQFFRVTECTCPFCTKSACDKKTHLKTALLAAAAAGATIAASCAPFPEPRPAYGIVVFPDAGTDGG